MEYMELLHHFHFLKMKEQMEERSITFYICSNIKFIRNEINWSVPNYLHATSK
jgi:hypothetical protein